MSPRRSPARSTRTASRTPTCSPARVAPARRRPRGSSRRRSTARRASTPSPCGECLRCREITEGSSLDVLEFDAASHTSVDDVREIRERIPYATAGGGRKVYIIDEAHQLSNPAFNALLKMLEEPPEHVVFVLCTTESHTFPATVVSRCQRFEFRRLTAEVLERAPPQHLATEGELRRRRQGARR